MRVLSPRMLPPETGLEGSTLSTATFSPRSRTMCMPSASMKVLLPGAGHAGDADAQRIAGLGEDALQDLRGQLAVAFQIAFDDRDGARERHPVALEDSFDVGFGRQASAAPHVRRRFVRVPARFWLHEGFP